MLLPYKCETSQHGRSGVVEEKITYAFSEQKTSITRKEEVVSIDYKDLYLKRYNSKTKLCTSYLLKNPTDTPLIVPEEEGHNHILMIRLLGSFKVITTNEQKKINSFNCQKKNIFFASDLALSQMAASPVLQQYGQSFTEVMVSCWVARGGAYFDELLRIAHEHKKNYKANPLLRQIDLAGLSEALEGVPIEFSVKKQNMTETCTLLNVEQISKGHEWFELPRTCQ